MNDSLRDARTEVPWLRHGEGGMLVGVRSYLRVVRAYWVVVLACLAIGLAGSGAVTAVTPSVYASETTLLLSTQRASSDSDIGYEGSLLAAEKARSYVELVGSEQLAADVIERLGIDADPVTLSESTTATLLPETALITVRVLGVSPLRARNIATALSERFTALVADLEQPIDPVSPPTVTVTVVEPATVATAPAAPSAVLNLALGAVLGLLAGVGVAVARDALRSPVRTADQLTRIAGAPLVGVVPADPRTPTEPIATVSRVDGPRAEAFRRIRTRLAITQADRPGRVVAVVSPSYGDGRTTTVCNLAVALAQAGRKVALVDCDLRRPAVERLLFAEVPTGEREGLSDVLAGEAKTEAVLREWRESSLSVLTAGTARSGPSDLLAGDGLRDVLTELADLHDVVLLDTPPLIPVSDAMAVVALCRDVVVVGRYGVTSAEGLRSAVHAVESVSGTIEGSILNRVPPRRASRIRRPRSGPAPAPVHDAVDEPRPQLGLASLTEMPTLHPRTQ